MEDIKRQIEEIVNRETQAWDEKNVDLLMTIFHEDMVWPWPQSPLDHDPMNWVLTWGRYDYNRWKNGWQELFNTHELVHNNRYLRKIIVSKEGDGAFAVVDIDTLWIDDQNNENHWKGRVCKVYTKVKNEWKMIMHTGVLDYSILSKKMKE
jgi:ketosteroid isomerase-like protein